MNFQPNLVNVIPNRVSFTVDLRNTDESILVAAELRDVGGGYRVACWLQAQ